MRAGTGISTRHPSTTPHGLTLGPDLPWAEQPAPGTLGQSAAPILTVLIATHACILTPTPSTVRSLDGFTGVQDAPLPNTHHPKTWVVAAVSAVCLSPATFSAQNHSTSELLRTLSRMAASKPTSWLLSRSYFLSHLAMSWGP